MFACDDRHPKILHDEYHCPLCDALDDLRYCRMMHEEYAGELLSPAVRRMVNLRLEDGYC